MNNASVPVFTKNASTLGEIVGAFKFKIINKYIQDVRDQNWPPYYQQLWQRLFYDRIILDEGV